MTEEWTGRLKERALWQRRAETRDALGGAVGDWQTQGTLWVALQPEAPASVSSAEAISGWPRWTVLLRAEQAVRPGDQLLWQGRRLAVRAALFDPQLPDRLTLRCEEVQP